jgi:hypothetical protein
MALSTRPFTYARAAVGVPGTAVSPNNPVPENCHTIIVLNTSAVDALYSQSAPGGPLTEGIDAARIPAGSSLTLDIGEVVMRGVIDEGTLAGSGLIFDGIGGAVVLNLTYLCNTGHAPRS